MKPPRLAHHLRAAVVGLAELVALSLFVAAVIAGAVALNN